ncbi:taste receptor type 1 member 2-like [Clupea harengus]|uniref:Taste receptor type 1 member 2-like n=1 Tax=Clupea harengus TaxID=7950 RepID=A0A8M1KHW0_CLUHA|nr:taste receptor type 1 member 2-like [Clupea harengus]
MQPALLRVLFTALFHHLIRGNPCEASEFNLDGDYLVGGLFPLHNLRKPFGEIRPVAVKCEMDSFSLPGYQMFQVMRFAVEEINNSTTLLPNVTLGYQLFDHCSDAHNFPAILQFFSHNSSIKAREDFKHHLPKVIGFTGPFSSTESITLAPLFMMDLIPMVNYGAGSSILSNKPKYPSFVRTIPSNKGQIELIIHIIQHFGWNWVAFIGSKTAYSENGFQLFFDLIQNTGICLAYQELLADTSQLNAVKVFQNIDMLNIKVIVLFIEQLSAEDIIASAIRLNFHNKVWIASDAWAMNQVLPKLQDIQTIGTVIGVTPTVVTLPGFNEFIYQSRHRSDSVHTAEGYCNQVCDNCSSVSPEDVINENPTYSFPIYSAVYTMAMALHNALQCNNSGCDKSRTVYPYMLLQEIKSLHFLLNQRNMSYDENLDPSVHFSIMFWDMNYTPAMIKKIGTYHSHLYTNFTIDDKQIDWNGGGSVPFSNCSVECKPGYVREQDGLQKCCFVCVKCPSDQYSNHTADLYSCFACDEDEWSEPGSTSCQKRSVEYLHFSEVLPILLLLSASSLMVLSLAVAVLFAIHRSTPVVRSAGGSMCFLMLGCLAASAISVFFYVGEPSALSCAFQNWTFVLFYTVCLSCLSVRSFQIICVFKMAAYLPKAHALWVKYSGQWLVVAGVSLLQLLLCGIWMATDRAIPERNTTSFKDRVLLICSIRYLIAPMFCAFFMFILSGLCFCFSYMGTDLPKNYNEARAITFSMLLFCLSWAIYITASMVSHSKYVLVIQAVVELSCLYGIMFSYFIPKSFIIVFQPLKNTQEYFQAAIQSYTQTISRM